MRRIASRCSAVRGRTTACTDGSAPRRSSTSGKQGVSVAVVERHVRRCTHDDEEPAAIEAQLVQDARTRNEPMEGVLLLEARVAPHLALARSETVEPVLRDRLRDDDAPRGPAAETVLRARELVVERVRGRDPERARDHRQLVRRVRERDVEVRGRGRTGAARAAGASSRAPSRPRVLRRAPARRPRAGSRAARAARSSARTRASSRPPRCHVRGAGRSAAGRTAPAASWRRRSRRALR